MENFGTERFWYDPYTSDTKVLSGMFPNRESTERAYKSLLEKGYSADEINLVMSDKTRDKHFNYLKKETEIDSKVEHAGNGFTIEDSNTIGTVAEVIAAVETSVEIPGLGILIAGPLTRQSTGAGGGDEAGVIGALVGLGIPEALAKLYDSGIKEGKAVIMLIPNDEADAIYLLNNWKTNLGKEVHY